jgi:imidazolonepropionase-like amidohydrolase
VVFGTDLLGHMHDRQSGEFDLRLQAMDAVAALQSATIDAARLLRQEGRLGELVPGALADLLLVEGDPTRGLQMLTRPDEGIRLIVQGGRIVSNRLAANAA